jgi:hypothetical protein
MDSERGFVVSNSLMTGLDDQLNFVDVGVDVTVKAPVDAVYESRLGLENVVVGSSGVTPSSAAMTAVPERNNKSPSVVRVRGLSMPVDGATLSPISTVQLKASISGGT